MDVRALSFSRTGTVISSVCVIVFDKERLRETSVVPVRKFPALGLKGTVAAAAAASQQQQGEERGGNGSLN